MRFLFFFTIIVFFNSYGQQSYIENFTKDEQTTISFDAGQSFTANSDGYLKEFTFYAAEPGIFYGGQFHIYNGNTIYGTPFYSQIQPSVEVYNAGDPITFNITGDVELKENQQYTFRFTVTSSIYYTLNNTYSGGNAWSSNSNNALTTNDLSFIVGIENLANYECGLLNKIDTNNLAGGNLIIAQSFRATCNELLENFNVYAKETGVVPSGDLYIYDGNTVSGEPLYTQTYPAIIMPTIEEPIPFDIAVEFPLIKDHQYTFKFTSNLDLHLSTTDIYSDGNAWVSGAIDIALKGDLSFAINDKSYEVLNTSEIKYDELKLFPNPTSDFITFSGVKNKVNYVIYDCLGSLFLEGTIVDNQKIDIKNFFKGVYYIKLNNGMIKKIIKK